MLAEPSTPRPTGIPSLSMSLTRATPEDSFMFDMGQCATPVPVCARTRSSSSLKWMPCANHTSGPTQPTDSMYASGRMPVASMVKRSSSRVSHR